MKSTVLSRNLRLLRKLRNLSQRSLAEALGLKRNNIASYEAGIVEPRAATFVRIADYFCLEPEDLLHTELRDDPQMVEAIQHRQRTQPRPPAGDRPFLHLAERRGIEIDKVLARLQDYRASLVGPGGQSQEPELSQLLEMLDQIVRDGYQSTQTG